MISRRAFQLITATGLLIFAVVAQQAAFRESPTFDEPIHIVSGYADWKQARQDLNFAEPPFIQDILALPLMPLSLTAPPPAPVSPMLVRQIGFDFVFHNRFPPDALIALSRFMTIVMAVLLGWLLARWSAEIGGPLAGVASLVAYAACPMILAHGHLATSDMGATFFFVLALYRLWRWWSEPTQTRAILVGVAWGFALCSKYSAITFLPGTLLPVIVTWIFSKDRPSNHYPWAAHGMSAVVSALATVMLCFHGWGIPNYWHGLENIQRLMSRGYYSFLLGSYRSSGWWYYYVATFLLKTPIPFLLILFGSLWPPARASSASRFFLRWALLPAAWFLATASLSSIQVGLRHALVLYPLCCLWIGAVVAHEWTIGGARRVFCSALGLWYVVGTLEVFPNYIAYVNAFAWGPEKASACVADSNLDWGQGLKGLGNYFRSRGGSTIYLSYFGCADPHQYGIPYRPVAMTTCVPLSGDALDSQPSAPTYFAISDTNRVGLYYPDHHLFDWLRQRHPEAIIGNSIWVYNITGDVDAMQHLHALGDVTPSISEKSVRSGTQSWR